MVILMKKTDKKNLQKNVIRIICLIMAVLMILGAIYLTLSMFIG